MTRLRYNVSIEPAVHDEAQWLARSLGLSFSRVLEQKLKQFIADEHAKFSKEYPLVKQGQSLKQIETRFQKIRMERARRLLWHNPRWRRISRIAHRASKERVC